MAEKFQRTKFRAYSKLGKGKKSKQKYRRCKGRHNKTREKRKGRPPRVETGYRTNKKERELIEGKGLVVIRTIEDLMKVSKDKLIVIGRMGKRKKAEIAKKAQEAGVKILNLNAEKFLKKIKKRREYKNKLKEEKKGKKKKKEDKKKAGEKEAGGKEDE